MNASRHDLEDAVRSQPDDVARRLVLGDLLQQLGDPAGALVAIQHEMEKDVARKRLANQYLSLNRAALLGELSDPEGRCFEWFLGSVRTVRLETTPAEAAKVIEVLPTLTVGRFVEAIEVTLQRDDDPAPVFEALARARHPGLKRLWVRGGVQGDFSSVWPALESLQMLSLSAQRTLGAVTPGLRSLSLYNVTEPQLEQLGASVASLDCLSLSTAAAATDQLAHLLSRQTGLRELFLSGPAVCDALCTVLARIARPKLERLSLIHGVMTLAGARTLARSPLRVQQLDVTGNLLEPVANAALLRVCPEVQFGFQLVSDGVAEPVRGRSATADGWLVLDRPAAAPELAARAAAMLGKHHGLRALVLETAQGVELAPQRPCTVIRVLGLGEKGLKLDELAESIGRRTENLRRADRYQVLCLHHARLTAAGWRLYDASGKRAEGAGADAEVIAEGLATLLGAQPRADFLERLATPGALSSVIWNHAPAAGRPVEGTRDSFQPVSGMDLAFMPPNNASEQNERAACIDCGGQNDLYSCEDCGEDLCSNCGREPPDRSAWVCHSCGAGEPDASERFVDE